MTFVEFFRDPQANDKRSMSRLVAFIAALCLLLLTIATCYVAIRHPSETATIAAVSAPLSALAGALIGALWQRAKGGPSA